MLRLEKPERDPENTVLKAPASENLCNIRVKKLQIADASFKITKSQAVATW